jgi:hypothetical protein
VGTLRFAHPADVPDGQIPHTRHAQIARRANLPQLLIPIFGKRLDFSPNQKHHPRRPALDKRGASRSSRTLSAGCDGRFGDARGLLLARTNGADADGEVVWS